MLSSLSGSTLKQYESALRKWWEFCIQNEYNFQQPDRTSLLSFLTDSFKSGASYATLNTYRSAVSLISTDKIGDDLVVNRFFKGIYNLRPACPKYSFTWDVSIVLRYLKTLEPLEDLDLQALTEKTVTLLALCSAHRAQTLASIKISNIKTNSENGLEIRVPDKIKTSGQGRFQPFITLPKYAQDARVCVVTVILRYIEVTKEIRNKEDRLFIATKKPHKAVTAQSISRWIKSVLSKSGIDTSIFSSHSTRHAATSAALKQGISLDVIRRTAGWTESSRVFGAFYNRPIVSENEKFSSAILNS